MVSSSAVVPKQKLVAALLAAKEASGKSLSQIAAEVRITNAYCGQLFLRQTPLASERTARRLAAAVPALTPDLLAAMKVIPERTNATAAAVLHEPAARRLHDIVGQYAGTVKMIVDEQLGDGVMSAEDFFMRLDTVKGSRGEDRVVILLDARFVPIAEQIHAESVADAESIRSVSAVPEVETGEELCFTEGGSVATERQDSMNGGGGAASAAAAQGRPGTSGLPPSSVVTRAFDMPDVADGAAARTMTDPSRPSPRSSRACSSSRSSATSTARSLTFAAGHRPLRSLTVSSRDRSSRERSSRGTGPRSGRGQAVASAAASAAATSRGGPSKGTPTQPPAEDAAPTSETTSPQTVPPPTGDADGYRSAAPSTVPSVPASSQYISAGHGALPTAGAVVPSPLSQPEITRDFQGATTVGGEGVEQAGERREKAASGDRGRISGSARSSRRSSRHSGEGGDGSSRASGERERLTRRSGSSTPRRSRRSSQLSRGTSGAGVEGATMPSTTLLVGGGTDDSLPSPGGDSSRHLSRQSSHLSSHRDGTRPSDGSSRHLSRHSSRRRSSSSHHISEGGPRAGSASLMSTGGGEAVVAGAESVGDDASAGGAGALDHQDSQTHSRGSSAGARLSARLSSEEVSLRQQESQSQERAIAWAAQQRASLDRPRLSTEMPDDPDAEIRREQAEARRRRDASELRARQEALLRLQPYQPTYAPPQPRVDATPQTYYRDDNGEEATAWQTREEASRVAPVHAYPDQGHRAWPAARDSEGSATAPSHGYVAARGASGTTTFVDGRHFGGSVPSQGYRESDSGAPGSAAYSFGSRADVGPSRVYGDGDHGAPPQPTYPGGRVAAGRNALGSASSTQPTHASELARTQAAWQARLIDYYHRQQQEYEHMEITQQQALAQQQAEEEARARQLAAEEESTVVTSPPPSLQSSVGVYAREPTGPPGGGLLPASVTTRSMEMGSGTSPFPSATTTTGSRPARDSASTSGPSDERPSIEPDETLTATATASIPTEPPGPSVERGSNESTMSRSSPRTESVSGSENYLPGAPTVPGELSPSVPDSGPVIRMDSSLAEGSSYGCPDSASMSIPGATPGLDRTLSTVSAGDTSVAAAMDAEPEHTSLMSSLPPALDRANDELPTAREIASSELLSPTPPAQIEPLSEQLSPSPPPPSSGDAGSLHEHSSRTSEQGMSPAPAKSAEPVSMVRDLSIAVDEVAPAAAVPIESDGPAMVPSLLSRLRERVLGSEESDDGGAAERDVGADSQPEEAYDDGFRSGISGDADVPIDLSLPRDEDQAAAADKHVKPVVTASSSSSPSESAATSEAKPSAGLLSLFRGKDTNRDDRSQSSRGSGDGDMTGERRSGLLGLFRRKGPDSEKIGSSTAERAADASETRISADEIATVAQRTGAEQESTRKSHGAAEATPVPGATPGTAPSSQVAELPEDHPTGGDLLDLFRRDHDERDLSSLGADSPAEDQGAPESSSATSSSGKAAKTGGILGLFRRDRSYEVEGSPTVTPPASTVDAERVPRQASASPPRRDKSGPAEGGPSTTLSTPVDDAVPVHPPTLKPSSRQGKPGEAASNLTEAHTVSAPDDAMPVLPPTSASRSHREVTGVGSGSPTATPLTSADDAAPDPPATFASPIHRGLPAEAEGSLTDTPMVPTDFVVPVSPPTLGSHVDSSVVSPPLSREVLEEHQRAQAAGRTAGRAHTLPTSSVTRGPEAVVTPSDSQSHGSRVAHTAVDEPPLASAQEASPTAAPVGDTTVEGSAGAMGSSDTAPYLSRNESAYTVHSALSALSSSTADGVATLASDQDTSSRVGGITREGTCVGEVTMAEAAAAGPERAAELLAQGHDDSTGGSDKASFAGDSGSVGPWQVSSKSERRAVRGDISEGGGEAASDKHPQADADAPWPSAGPIIDTGGAATLIGATVPRTSSSSTGSTDTDGSGGGGSPSQLPGEGDDADSSGGFLSHLKERVLGRRRRKKRNARDSAAAAAAAAAADGVDVVALPPGGEVPEDALVSPPPGARPATPPAPPAGGADAMSTTRGLVLGAMAATVADDVTRDVRVGIHETPGAGVADEVTPPYGAAADTEAPPAPPPAMGAPPTPVTPPVSSSGRSAVRGSLVSAPRSGPQSASSSGSPSGSPSVSLSGSGTASASGSSGGGSAGRHSHRRRRHRTVAATAPAAVGATTVAAGEAGLAAAMARAEESGRVEAARLAAKRSLLEGDTIAPADVAAADTPEMAAIEGSFARTVDYGRATFTVEDLPRPFTRGTATV